MHKNQHGIIYAIGITGDLGRRLREMGFIPGTHIKVCGRAPLHDPVAVRILDNTITLRNNEADYIFVDIEEL